MRRREFVLLTAAAAVCPFAASAQAERMCRMGLLMPYAENDPSAIARVAALKAGLKALGWIEGANLDILYRYTAQVGLMKTYATELVQQSPELIVTTTNLTTMALYHATKTIPIVFIGGGDMINEGLVASLAHPGGNVTGFTNFEPSMGSKWLGLLKEIMPDLRRAGFLHNPDTLANINDMRTAQSAASALNLNIVPLAVRNADEIERVIADFATKAGGGLIVAPNPVIIGNHDLIVGQATSHQLPGIYPFDFFARSGGLMSYGPDQVGMFRNSSSYIDRILKGTKPGDLPVQMPTTFELIVNQKTAKSIGITVPTSLLARADEVIE